MGIQSETGFTVALFTGRVKWPLVNYGNHSVNLPESMSSARQQISSFDA